MPGGGHFGRAADGKLNEMVYEESAMLKFAVHFLGKITPDLAAKAVTHFCEHIASVGTTMMHEPGTIRSKLDRAVREALERACLPHQRERDV